MRVFRSKNTSFTLKMCILLLGGAVCATNLHSNEPAGENSVVPFQSDNTLAIDLSSETRKLTWKACDGKDVTAEGVLSQAGKGIPRLLLDNTSVFLGKEERLGTESDGRLVRIKGRLVTNGVRWSARSYQGQACSPVVWERRLNAAGLCKVYWILYRCGQLGAHSESASVRNRRAVAEVTVAACTGPYSEQWEQRDGSDWSINYRISYSHG